MNLITADMLLERWAHKNCADIAIIRKRWPNGVVPSLAAFLEAAELRLDLNWFANHFISAKARRIYWAAIAEPRRVYWADMDETWRIYQADTDEARRICLAAKAEALWTAWQIDNPEPRSEP